MGHILLIWGFPFYLIIIEAIFRSVSGLDVSSFIGPAISTAGLSFLLPLTKPKGYIASEELIQAVQRVGGEIANTKDQKLIPFVWISILCGFLIWFWTASISTNYPNDNFYFLPMHVAVGLINFCLAAFFTTIKVRI